MYLISVAHSITALFLVSYGILFTRSRFDYVILIILFSILLSQSLYKGECLLSYYLKKYNDPHYKLGSNIYSEDMWIIFGEKYIPYLKRLFTLITPLIGTITVYLLLKRQHFTTLETLFYPIIYYAYYYLKFLKSSVLNLFFTFVFLFTLYRIVKRFILSMKQYTSGNNRFRIE
jgi:hypothetical protein